LRAQPTLKVMFGRPDRTTASEFGDRVSLGAKSSPLEGPASYYGQTPEINLKKLGRSEWWLWFSAVTVTTLSVVTVALTAFSRLFRHKEHFYEMSPEQARWGILCLLLLFNAWMLYRQRTFRKLRRQATAPGAGSEDPTAGMNETAAIDPVTGLYTRTSALLHLGKEIARAKRKNTALSLATIHLEDLADLNRQFGKTAVDQALKEFAGRLKEVSRGSDYAVRLANDDFVLVLPKCNVGEVTRVLNRMGSMDLECAGKKISLAYTTGWVDYQPGDMPSDLLKRASELLHLYGDAAKETYTATGTSN
jgi:diguanylate cyclase (GGDEF)-like protein